MSEHFQAAQRSDTVNDERPDGEEGETQPETEGAPDTREEVHRLHHVVLLHYTAHTLVLLTMGRVKKFLLNRLVESSNNFYATHPLVP